MEENFNQNETLESTPETPSTEMAQPEASQPQTDDDKKSVGPIVGIAIIVVILIFGGLYYWGSKLDINDETIIDIVDAPTTEEILNEQDVTLERLQIQDTSDEIADIEADLDLTDLNDLDAELGNIDTELGL
jgi:uncharacterized protein HemX